MLVRDIRTNKYFVKEDLSPHPLGAANTGTVHRPDIISGYWMGQEEANKGNISAKKTI